MTLSSIAITTTKTKTKLFTSKFTQETRDKMSKAKMGAKNPNYGKTGKKSNVWKGGSYTYYHIKAKELHSNGICDKCGLKLKDKASEQEFDMHCWGDYKNLDKKNWAELCRSCHKKTHHAINKLKFQ